jgi:hypothetical protein
MLCSVEHRDYFLNKDVRVKSKKARTAASTKPPQALRGGTRDARRSKNETLLQSQAHQTFIRALPELLEHHSGQWVAYRGQTQLGLGAGKTALLQKCLRRGLDPKEITLQRIHPGADEPPTLFLP